MVQKTGGLGMSAYVVFSLLIFISLIGGFLQAGMGMGLVILCMIFFPMLFPLNTAVGLAVAIPIISNLALGLIYRKHVQWKVVLSCGIVSSVISVVFATLSLSWNENYVKIGLGFVLIVLAIYFDRYSENIRIKPTIRNGAIAGIAGGLGNGLFGLAGPPVGLFFAAALPGNAAYLGSIQFYFLLINVVAIVTRTAHHAFGLEHIPMIIAGSVTSCLGIWLGIHFFEKLPKKTVRRLVYLAIAIGGLNAIAQSIIQLLSKS